MKRLCYFCTSDMGEKGDNSGEVVFYSVCDWCAKKLRLDERLPELIWAIAASRKQNARGGQNQTLGEEVMINY